MRLKRAGIVAVSAVVALVAGVVWAGPSWAIVGGHDAVRVYKGMAALEIEFPQGTGLCGAYLVGERWAATNAHCVTEEPPGGTLPASAMKLRVGTNNRTTGAVVLVDKVLVHSGWTWGVGAPELAVSDIAMLHLTTKVKGAAFGIARRVSTRAPITLIGYGLTDAVPVPTSQPAVHLQELRGARILEPSVCATGFLSPGELCVSNVDGVRGVCFGDSGSPVLQSGKVIGSNSRGIRNEGTCGTGPEVITDTTYYREWMIQVMRTGKVPPAPIGVLQNGTTGPKDLNWYRSY